MSNTTTAPPGWSFSAIGDICAFSRGVSWKKSQERRFSTAGAVPVLRIPNVQRTLELTELLYIEGLTKAQQTKARVKVGWTLLVGSNGNPKRVGNCVYVANPKELLIASFLIGAKPADPARVDSRFLYRLLSWGPVQNDISQSVQGSTGLCNLDLNMLKSLHVPIPSLSEQRKIAAILSSVDDAIEKTQALIDQVVVVKCGLMQELLTRGLPGRHTRFKQTEIGEIPEEWEVVRLGELFKLTSGKSIAVRSLDEESSTENPYPVYGGNGIAGFTSSMNAEPPLLVIGRVGEYCGIVHCPDQPCWVSDNALYTRNWLRLVNVTFLHWLLQFVNLAKLRKKSGQPLVTQGPIHDLTVPLAPLSEQDEMAEMLDQFDARLRVEERKLESLHNTKLALMSVLLTGELRVTPDPEVA